MSVDRRTAAFSTSIERATRPVNLEHLQELRAGILNVFNQTELAIGTFSHLIYFAGGGDGFSTLISENLHIFDRAPFWNKARFAAVDSILSTGQPVSLTTLEQITPGLMQESIDAGLNHLDNSDANGEGYQLSTYGHSLPSLIGSLLVIGIDFNDITLTKSEVVTSVRTNQRYTLSYQLNGSTHFIHYIEEELPVNRPLRMGDNLQQARAKQNVREIISEIQLEGRRIGLYVKADQKNITLNFPEIDPDGLIYDERESLPMSLLNGFDDTDIVEIHPQVVYGYGKRDGRSIMYCLNRRKRRI
ncbi:MAG TPA: hypothetical protein VF820_07135 [Patescibacteria group bacterium]